MNAAMHGRWEDEPVTRGEYSKDLGEVRGMIARLQYVVGVCVGLGTLITSLVSWLHGGH